MTDETGKVDPEAELKAELISKAEKAGVKVDRRWTAARMEQALGDAALEQAQPSPPEGWVTVRITKQGRDKVSDGEGGYFDWDAVVQLPSETAQALEDRGYAEIR